MKKDSQISRRGFLSLFIQGGLAVTLMGLLAPVLSYLSPVTRQGPGLGAKEVGTEDEIPIWGSKKVIIGGSAMLVMRTPQGFKAFSAICTHLGCVVDWDDQKRQIQCPCHAGVFDLEGRVVSGPAPRPLPEHAVSVVDGKIFVKV